MAVSRLFFVVCGCVGACSGYTKLQGTSAGYETLGRIVNMSSGCKKRRAMRTSQMATPRIEEDGSVQPVKNSKDDEFVKDNSGNKKKESMKDNGDNKRKLAQASPRAVAKR